MTTARRRGFNDALTRFWSFVAPAYDLRVLQRWVYRPPQDEVLAQLRTSGARRVVDIACGTGILADRIKRELHPDEVYGVDMSEGMLARARARSSQVRWLRGPAEQLPFADGSLDAVVTTSAFHFFEQRVALGEFHRVLAPGGLVAVTTISPPQNLPLHRLVGNRLNPEHNPSPSEMQALFESAGFSVREQHRIRRPVWKKLVSDLITVATKP